MTKGNWPIKKLAEVATVSAGGSAPQGKKYFENGTHNFYRTSDVGAVHLTTGLSNSADKLNEYGTMGLKLFPQKTILFPKSGASTFLDHRVMIAEAGYVSSHLATIIAGTSLNPEYLYYFLTTVKARSLTSEVTYPSLRLSQLDGIEIPLPPIEEQKRIVVKLENLLGNVKEAKRLRGEAQAAIANLFPAELHKVLFGTKLKTTKLLELLERVNNVDAKNFSTEEFDYVDISSVAAGKGIFTHKVYSRTTAPSRARRPIKKGDVLFALTRPYLRNIAFVQDEYDDAIASTGFAVLRAQKAELDPKFLYYVVSSDWFVEKVLPFQRGATYPAINESDILIQGIPLPPLAEQKKIVARLDSLSEKIRQLQDYQKQTATDLDALEKSILHQAFSGKL